MVSVGYFTIEHFIIEIKSQNSYIISVQLVDKLGEEIYCSEIEKFKLQLKEYFEGIRTSFDVKYLINQLPFRTKVFNIIQEVEYSNLVSCKDILASVGLKKGVSVIVRAMYANPLIILIPTHRVTNHIRRLSAYNYSDEFRQLLLNIETIKH